MVIQRACLCCLIGEMNPIAGSALEPLSARMCAVIIITTTTTDAYLPTGSDDSWSDNSVRSFWVRISSVRLWADLAPAQVSLRQVNKQPASIGAAIEGQVYIMAYSAIDAERSSIHNRMN